MEHCHLLLLLLQKFPMSISTHGPKLVDTLLTAEKHSHASTQPLNNYRKLLVCDLLPLLASDKTSIDLPPKMLYKLLNKSIEFYLHSILKVASNVQELRIEDPWKRLFEIIHFIGRHLGWEPYLTEFTPDWTKEKYWPKILMFCQKFKSVLVEDHGYTKQLFYCLTIFFLHCLASYSASLNPETAPGQTQITFLLVEAFSDPSISKRHKGDNHVPVITVDKAEYKEIINNFTMLVNCWDMLHSSTHLYKEFQKLSADIKLDVWFNPFLIDYSMYKGHYDNCLSRLEQVTDPFLVSIRLANILYLKKDFTACFEQILLTIQALPARTTSPLSTQLTVGGNQRHMHFLSLTHNSVLQLCVKLLLRCIRENLAKQTYNELGIGHILVLLQFDWPQEEDLLPTLVEQIRQRGAFSYMLFQGYIINVDILEELTYLATEQGGQITLDILPHLGQRRIGTRGADKGAREEIRLAIRRQIARSNEALDQLMVKFISQERGHILQSLM